MRISDWSSDVCSSDLCSDLFEQLPDCEYKLIICNPPYVNNHSMEHLPQEYRHEPTMALAGGDDGMDLIRRLLQQAPAFMAPDDLLVLEIGHEYQNFLAAFPRSEEHTSELQSLMRIS